MIRLGFVSNSSSSSFTCDICGRSYICWDAGLRDAEMAVCCNGHTVCWNELMELPSKMDEGGESFPYEFPEKYCPICNFLESSSKVLAQHLEKETKIPRAEAFAEVKKLNRRRKKLQDNECVIYACQKSGIDGSKILATMKERFGTYGKFLEWLKS